MSKRAEAGHIDDYGRQHIFEIHDSQYSGAVTDLKGTGPGYASMEYQKIDPRKPQEKPIQKGALEISLWIESGQEQLLTDIKTSDEKRFHIVHKIDTAPQWQGYIYNDLSEYEENELPYRATFQAKDFTDLAGKDFVPEDNRETIITTVAGILNEIGFSIPIKTHTSWIESHITASKDYLRQIYHETKALREFGRTGDEADEAITLEESLEKICANHGLIIKQTGGAYYIDQLTEFDDPTSVLQSEYDLTGAFQSEDAALDRTASANTNDLKVVIEEDNRDNSGLPGLRKARVKYDHRSKVSGMKLPDPIDITTASKDYSQLFISTGDQIIRVGSGDIIANSITYNEDLVASVTIKIVGTPDTYYWDGDSWGTSPADVSIPLTYVRNNDPYDDREMYEGSFSVVTSATPVDADGTLHVIFNQASNADRTIYRGTSFEIESNIVKADATSIDYQITQVDSYSATFKYADTWYGDGPGQSAVSALRYSANDSDTTADSWQRRGSTSYRNFHENLLKESMDIQRGWRRLLSATLKGKFKAHQILSYDGSFFYCLGGSQDLFTGNWSVELLELNIVEDAADTFEDIPKFSDAESSSGTASSGMGQGTADNRYFIQSNNLSEGDPASMRSNVGLSGTDDVSFNTVGANGNIVAYQDGTPAGPSGGTYAATVLNLTGATAQLNYKSNPLFDQDGTINDSFIDGGTASAVSWSNITGKPTTVSEWRTETGFGTAATKDTSYFATASHSHGYDDLPMSASDISHGNTAYAERGSQIAGTGLSWSAGNLNIDNAFNPAGTYANLRAQATTKDDVGLGNVPNSANLSSFTNDAGYNDDTGVIDLTYRTLPTGSGDWDNYTNPGTQYPLSRSSDNANSPDNTYRYPIVYEYKNSGNISQLALGYGRSVTDILYARGMYNNTFGPWHKFWTDQNHGLGSGLDSDLLDGYHGAHYRNASNLNAGTIADARLPQTQSGKTFTSAVRYATPNAILRTHDSARILIGGGSGYTSSKGAYMQLQGVNYGGSGQGGDLSLAPAGNGGVVLRRSTKVQTSIGVGTAPSGVTGEIKATGNIIAYA